MTQYVHRSISRRTPPKGRGFRLLLQFANILSCRAFGAVANIKTDPITLCQ